jgi:hypothetical protein
MRVITFVTAKSGKVSWLHTNKIRDYAILI